MQGYKKNLFIEKKILENSFFQEKTFLKENNL